MTYDLFLKPLFLINIIAVLFIGWVITLGIAFKQYRLIRKMLARLVEFQASRRADDSSAKPSFASNPLNSAVLADKESPHVNTSDSNIPQIVGSLHDYFTRSIIDSAHRYEKFTHSKIIVFDGSRPHSEKAAALRYLYLTLEREAEERKVNLATGWNYYEEKLALLLNVLNKMSTDSDTKKLQIQFDEYRTESRETIERLKEMITNLEHSSLIGRQAAQEYEIGVALESIISDENIEKIRDLFDVIKAAAKATNLQPNQLEKSLSSIEYEMENSDRYLNKIRNNPESVAVSLDEVNKLKKSNKAHRNTILTLEQEISLLRDTVDNGASDEDKATKENEIAKLEKTVLEYENCVIILESQIDGLYEQLEQQKNLPSQHEKESQNPILQQSAELESMMQRMNIITNDYRCAASLNRSIYNFSQCKTIKEIAANMIELLEEFNISTGFYINSTLGKIDYFPSQLFSDDLKNTIKNSTERGHITSLEGNWLFVAARIKIIFLSTPESTGSINTTLSGLVCAVSANVQRIETQMKVKKNKVKVESWISTAKEKLRAIDIQNAYQTEEAKKIYNEFITAFKKAYSLLELKGDAAVLLENAINQYDMCMQLSVLSGDVVDKELSNLVVYINELTFE